jgi:acyl carrier protein
MNKDSILADLQSLFRAHFNNEQLSILGHTTQGDIPQWDSLNHAILIDKIEQLYAIKFDLMDMISMHSIGDICDTILAKQNN